MRIRRMFMLACVGLRSEVYTCVIIKKKSVHVCNLGPEEAEPRRRTLPDFVPPLTLLPKSQFF